MKNVIVLILVLFPFIGFTQIQIGQDIDGESAGDGSGWDISLSSDGNIVAIGARTNDGNGRNSGHVRVYEIQEDLWVQIGQDIDGEAVDDGSGVSVSLSSDGSIVAIGAPSNDGIGGGSGHVRIYEIQEDLWVQIGEDIDGEAPGDASGSSISLSSDGSIIAIGAITNAGNGNSSGHVRVYENSGGTWIQIGEDIDGEMIRDFSGRDVSLSSDGSILAIGAPSNDENGDSSGHVRIYENIGGSWSQLGEDIDGEAAGDNLGWSISLSSDGSIVAIGANTANNDNSGHVIIYENIEGSWIQVGENIDGESARDNSGYSVSLSSDGSIVAIGAILNDDNGGASGHVRVYQNIGSNWIQIREDIDGEATSDRSGWDVSLSSDGFIVAIGSMDNNGNGDDSGHVRIFDLSDVALSTQESTLTTFSIFPNPANSTLTISLSNSDRLEQVIIYNSLGQKVLTSSQSTIDISSLSSGIFFLEAITSQGKGIQKLLVE